MWPTVSIRLVLLADRLGSRGGPRRGRLPLPDLLFLGRLLHTRLPLAGPQRGHFPLPVLDREAPPLAVDQSSNLVPFLFLLMPTLMYSPGL